MQYSAHQRSVNILYNILQLLEYRCFWILSIQWQHDNSALYAAITSIVSTPSYQYSFHEFVTVGISSVQFLQEKLFLHKPKIWARGHEMKPVKTVWFVSERTGNQNSLTGYIRKQFLTSHLFYYREHNCVCNRL